ncbi:MAG: DUF6351 family protein [Acidobacteria bacterium]|nr:DUF6351 family protein [Acidobacteriota bacterium]
MNRAFTIGVLTAGLCLASVHAQQPGGDSLEILALSAMPGLVSGGDVLVQIAGPASLAVGGVADDVSVTLDGRDVTSAFKSVAGSGAVVGLLTGLRDGSNTIEASIGDRTTRLAVVNHPISGPVIYSPQQTPFICETESHGLGAPLDAHCSANTTVEYFYRSDPAASPTDQGDLAAGDNANGFQGGDPGPYRPLDPDGPRPAGILMTTTTEGKTVPYIVRREMGTINRAVYSIAFLHEPGTPLPSPWSTGSSWNSRLVYSFGGGLQAGYHQGRTVGGLRGNRQNLEDSQLGDFPIAKGYALVGASLNVFGTHSSDVVSAETMMMVKEHFIEQFGVPAYTMGSGRSGGSMQQHLIGNNYPGLLDGIVPTASYADSLTVMTALADCELLDRAMTLTPVPWRTAEKTAVSGYSHFDYCTNNKLRYAPVSANLNCDATTIPPAMRFDAASNPRGVRCTLQDSLVNVFGRDPETGFARRPFDNVGVQYGLGALNAEDISFAQFIDLNMRIGGHDINGNVVAERTVADPDALRLAYTTGRINDTVQGLSMIPIIDMRPYTEGPGGNVHDTYSGTITRARIIANNGNADNHVSRVYAPGASIVQAQSDNLMILDEWLAAIVADAAPGTPREKVARNRPAGLTDSCFNAELEASTDTAACAEVFPVYGNPRSVAGARAAGDQMKCQLKPIEPADYGEPLTDAQLAGLRAVFPEGVCDYSKDGVSQQPPATWLTFIDEPGGTR